MSDTHEIVIIGAGFAGLSTTHHLLKTILPALSPQTHLSYHLTLLSPSPDFFHRISAPRALINPHLLPLSRTLVPLAPGLAPYPPSALTHITGLATSISHPTKTLSYTPTDADGSALSTTDGASPTRTLRYDSLVIASGADAVDGACYWGVTPGPAAVRAAYAELHARLEPAEVVLVGGGGPVGVETAGELAERFGGEMRAGRKEVMLVSGARRLLAGIDSEAYGRDAERKLVAKGVRVLHGVKVGRVGEGEGGRTVVELRGAEGGEGERRVVDVYIPTAGLRVNSGFVPSEWREEGGGGRVRCEAKGFRVVDEQGEVVTGVYAFGSVGSYSDGSLFDVRFAYKAMGESFRTDQINGNGGSVSPRWSFYTKWQNRNLQFTPIGRNDGVVIVLGWRVWGWICVLIKSRTFFVNKQVPEYVFGKGL